jgi:hypothetical protein
MPFAKSDLNPMEILMQKQIKTVTVTTSTSLRRILKNQEGRVGYLIAWMLGVPASVLFLIFLVRGH